MGATCPPTEALLASCWSLEDKAGRQAARSPEPGAQPHQAPKRAVQPPVRWHPRRSGPRSPGTHPDALSVGAGPWAAGMALAVPGLQALCWARARGRLHPLSRPWWVSASSRLGRWWRGPEDQVSLCGQHSSQATKPSAPASVPPRQGPPALSPRGHEHTWPGCPGVQVRPGVLVPELPLTAPSRVNLLVG